MTVCLVYSDLYDIVIGIWYIALINSQIYFGAK